MLPESLPRSAMGWSAMCHSGIYWSYSLTFCIETVSSCVFLLSTYSFFINFIARLKHIAHSFFFKSSPFLQYSIPQNLTSSLTCQFPILYCYSCKILKLLILFIIFHFLSLKRWLIVNVLWSFCLNWKMIFSFNYVIHLLLENLQKHLNMIHKFM